MVIIIIIYYFIIVINNINLREFALCYSRHPGDMRGERGFPKWKLTPVPLESGRCVRDRCFWNDHLNQKWPLFSSHM